jgi:hypothetical protein
VTADRPMMSQKKPAVLQKKKKIQNSSEIVFQERIYIKKNEKYNKISEKGNLTIE